MYKYACMKKVIKVNHVFHNKYHTHMYLSFDVSDLRKRSDPVLKPTGMGTKTGKQIVFLLIRSSIYIREHPGIEVFRIRFPIIPEIQRT